MANSMSGQAPDAITKQDLSGVRIWVSLGKILDNLLSKTHVEG